MSEALHLAGNCLVLNERVAAILDVREYQPVTGTLFFFLHFRHRSVRPAIAQLHFHPRKPSHYPYRVQSDRGFVELCCCSGSSCLCVAMPPRVALVISTMAASVCGCNGRLALNSEIAGWGRFRNQARATSNCMSAAGTAAHARQLVAGFAWNLLDRYS
jgi:hypothetical protein